MATIADQLPFWRAHHSDRSSPIQKTILLHPELKKRINNFVKKFISGNKDIREYFRLKGIAFYQINFRKGSPLLSLSEDRRIWNAVESHFIPKDLKKSLLEAKNYLESLNPNALRIGKDIQKRAINKLRQEEQGFVQKIKNALVPLTTCFLGIGMGLEHALGTGHTAAQAMSFSSSGYPVAAYFQKKDAEKQSDQMQQIKDLEGIKESHMLSIEAISNFIGGLFFLAYKVAKQFLTHEVVLISLALLMSPFYLLAYSIEIVLQSNKINKTRYIQKKIDEYMSNPHLNNKQKIQGVLQYLRGFALVTGEEKNKIKEQVRKSHLNYSEQNQLIEQRLNDLHAIKVNKLQRRIGNKGLQKFFNEANQVLDALNQSSTKHQGIEQGMRLIQGIQQSAANQKLWYLAYLVAAIIGSVLIGALMVL